MKYLKTAILVDASFFIIRYKQIFSKNFTGSTGLTGTDIANALFKHCKKHIHRDKDELFRIYVYDSEPSAKKVHYPISHKSLDFKKSSQYLERTDFHNQIKKLPNFALRLGFLDDKYGEWEFKSSKIIKELINKTKTIDDLTDDDFKYSYKQKGVDIKIGLDIATLAYKRFVDKIVLITADSDFVPAIKHARREGLFIQLDPMHHPIKPDLLEHIDRLKSAISAPKT